MGLSLARLDIKIAQPLLTLTNDATFDERLAAIIRDQSVATLVVGLPRGLEGQDTAQTATVKRFAAEHLSMYHIVFQDEALTSKLAEAELARKQLRYTKEQVDALAACYILGDYLEQLIQEEGRS